MIGASIGLPMAVFLIALALAFDFMNGFHDAANSIATVVSTRVLRPHWAIAWAAFFNFVAFLVFGLAVADTIGRGVIETRVVDAFVLIGALTGAIAWNVITWWVGLPSSSSHALIGGLGGAAAAKAGFGALVGSGFAKIGAAIVLSPALGLALGMLLMTALSWILFRKAPHRVDRWFRRLQLVSAALYSLGHGGNDAQKTMGVVALVLVAFGTLPPTFGPRDIPLWVVLGCQSAMALGTLFGGWRIVKTMGMKITKLKPVGGFCAESAGAATLFLATHFGIPVSTTHTITGAIVGVGATRKLSAVRWGIARRIVFAWILTMPASAAIAAATWWIASRFA
ncbi:MAG TPA: inorganic phosphate transporter [Casimicrobiaceae bacterium]|jgi:PiT family inorganic phosphate transporter|nr:inorganic phosphate transporter [Casimicrobiaceae bacterium]